MFLFDQISNQNTKSKMFILYLLSLRSLTVADLTKESFFEFTSNDQRISVIHFYGKNCPACVDSEDTFEELSRMYWQEPRVRFGQLDCDRYSDVCDSIGAVDRPAWLAWIPGQTRAKRYNRNIDTDQFEKWIRQQTGIWPTAKQNNLLYINSTELNLMTKKKMNCIFTIIDTPRMDESQNLHNASRTLEKTVKRGVKFAAIDKRNSKDYAEKLLKNSDKNSFGAFVFSKGSWTKYDGKSDPDSIKTFLKDKKCNILIATPTPTPTPLEELEDLPDDEYVPFDEEETNKDTNKKTEDEDFHEKNNEKENHKKVEDEDDSEWSNDDEM